MKAITVILAVLLVLSNIFIIRLSNESSKYKMRTLDYQSMYISEQQAHYQTLLEYREYLLIHRALQVKYMDTLKKYKKLKDK